MFQHHTVRFKNVRFHGHRRATLTWRCTCGTTGIETATAEDHSFQHHGTIELAGAPR